MHINAATRVPPFRRRFNFDSLAREHDGGDVGAGAASVSAAARGLGREDTKSLTHAGVSVLSFSRNSQPAWNPRGGRLVVVRERTPSCC